MNNDILVTNAMLAAYLQTENRDYLSLVKPFVLYLLPNVGERVKVSTITKQLKEEFGFSSIIDNVVTKILLRICKEDKYLEGGYNNSFKVVTEYEKKEFLTKQTEIRNRLQEVIDELKKYLEENKYGKKIKEEVVQKALLDFLANYNYIFDDINKIIRISGDQKETDDSFWVARFIINVYKEDKDIYLSFLEVVKGSLASRAIELYSREDKIEEDSRLTDTLFFFDTRLLISALGLAREEENNATAELVKLINENGGTVATFECYVKELHGILTKYIRDENARPELSLDYFNRIHANTIIVQQYADGLKEELSKVNISVHEEVTKDEAIANLDWPIDIEGLEASLREYVKYDLEDQRGVDALNTDAAAIENISILRYGIEGKQSLENCKAVLVTQNRKITYAVYQYFKKLRERKGISLVVSEVDLSALLWLSYCRNESNLPECRLLENAYAACYPTKQVLDEFNNCILALKALGIVDEKKLFLVKSNRISLETLADKTENNPKNVTEEKVRELLEEAEDIYRKELEEEFAEKNETIERKRKDIDKEQKRREDDYSRKKSEIDVQIRHIEKEKQSIKEEKKQIKQHDDAIKQNAHKKADEMANKHRKHIEKVLKWLALLVLVIIILFLSYGAYLSFSSQANIICKGAIVFFIIVSLMGAIEIVSKKFNMFISPLITKMGAKAYKKKYDEAIANFNSVIE